MTWWIWILAGIVLAALELLTPGGFFIIFFGAAAVVVGIMSGLGIAGPPWLEWILFSGLSILSLLLFRKPLLDRIRRGESNVGPVDALEGERVIVLEKMDAGGFGRVELRGSTWQARNEGSLVMNVGGSARVTRVEGLTLVVRPEGGNS